MASHARTLFVLFTLALTAVSCAHAQPPAWWVADALCVHDGWHYESAGHGRPDYFLFGHGYWRSWKTSSNGEGTWDASDYGYGGGLQMDQAFQSKYGREYVSRYGDAGNWPPAVQIAVAYRGWLRQGWGAWPNTSRACGLE